MHAFCKSGASHPGKPSASTKRFPDPKPYTQRSTALGRINFLHLKPDDTVNLEPCSHVWEAGPNALEATASLMAALKPCQRAMTSGLGEKVQGFRNFRVWPFSSFRVCFYLNCPYGSYMTERLSSYALSCHATVKGGLATSVVLLS